MKKFITTIVFTCMLLSFSACASKETVNMSVDVPTVSADETVLETTVSVEESKNEITTSVSVTEETTVSAEVVAETSVVTLTDMELLDTRIVAERLIEIYNFITLNVSCIDKDVYYDDSNILEEGRFGANDGWCYVAVNENFAKTQEDLFNIARACITENYISDAALETYLFEAQYTTDGELVHKARFTVIDNVLCVDVSGSQSEVDVIVENTPIEIIDANTIKIYAEHYNWENYLLDTKHFTLVKCTDSTYGWQIDCVQFADGAQMYTFE